MLQTIEKLQRRAKELDQKVKRSVSYNDYAFGAADDRDLLEEAIKALRPPLLIGWDVGGADFAEPDMRSGYGFYER